LLFAICHWSLTPFHRLFYNDPALVVVLTTEADNVSELESGTHQ
jgi:hypothetical protein